MIHKMKLFAIGIIMMAFLFGNAFSVQALSGWILFSNNDYGCGWEKHPGWSELSSINSFEIGLNLAMFAASGANTLNLMQIQHKGATHRPRSGSANRVPTMKKLIRRLS